MLNFKNETMKKLLLLTKTLLAVALLCVGQNAVADPYDVTWDFTVAGRWAVNGKDGANLISITDASKQFGYDAQEVVSGGVTFNFEAEDGARFRASNSCYLLFNLAGSATTNNVSIDVPNGYRVSLAFNKVSNSRLIKYTVDGGANVGNISADFEYDNTTGATVTFTFWANNPGNLTNMLNSIRLRDVSSVVTHDYTVTAKCGETTIDTWSGTEIEEGATYYVPAKAYIYTNSKYYVLDDAKYTAPNFGYQQTMGTADAAFEIAYTEYTAGDIVYFAEAETLNSEAMYSTNNASNGKRSHANGSGKLSIGNLAAGVYAFDLGTNDNRAVYFRDNGNNDNNTNTITYVNSNTATGSFTLTAETPVVITGYTTGSGGLNQSGDFDYVLVKKTGEVATIGATGWTTFASPYALNLSSMTASTGEVTAFYASATSAESVTVLPTASSAVKAGEGILLKGTAGATITIPVVATGSEISGNLMVGCPTAASITKETANYDKCYVLGIEDEKAVFQNIKNYCDAGNTVSIPAGKAYLNATASNGARSMRIVFSDITGVDNVEAAAEATLKDGKYLENGKIVIVKNGQKFNAAGQQVK